MHLRWSLFLTRLEAWGPAILLKKTPRNVFYNIFKNIYFAEHLQVVSLELLLIIDGLCKILLKIFFLYHMNNRVFDLFFVIFSS